jgi:hypothetical protein
MNHIRARTLMVTIVLANRLTRGHLPKARRVVGGRWKSLEHRQQGR